MSKKYSIILLLLIIILAIGAGIFIYPLFNKLNVRPWRLGLDLVGGSHLIYEVDMSQVDKKDKDSVMNGLREVIEKRVNLFGVSEPRVTASKIGESFRLIVELAGIKDIGEAVKEIGSTPLLDFREVIYTQIEEKTNDNTKESIQFIPTNLTGRYMEGAQLDFNQTTGAAQINIQFNSEGAKIFEELTEKNVGQPLAIFLDNQLIEMPMVREKITGGRAQITGKFTIDEAKKMVERFNAGALPAPINLISQYTIGASLGARSLDSAIKAGAWGILLIMIFMVLYYRSFGVFASLALLIYVILTLSVFKSLSITMTLAGIAGFILSIGMAVDANILIFERTKEEIKKGLSRISAVEEGFKRAWSSIRDSNIATIISSVILYYSTSSFVKGFALALLIGVLVSMFSAITVTRTMLRVFTRATSD
ncbi:MAG TPA: protein translocase subunit SecD [Candidatus Wolfebacteria bacterium]|nr:protein translocase subunit SecD [Candidatus Wolfebacteria bacterium]